MKKIISIIISLIVISLLLALFIMPKIEFSYNENKYLAKFPKFKEHGNYRDLEFDPKYNKSLSIF